MRNTTPIDLIHVILAAIPLVAGNPFPRACEAPLITPPDNAVPGVYAVKFAEGWTLDDHFKAIGEQLTVTELNEGYFADLTDQQLAKVRTDCEVKFVEQDSTGEDEEVSSCEMGRTDLSNSTSSLGRRATQQDAPWPLYQISASTKAPTDKTYYYLDDISSGVDIYIMDSGINHPLDEFKDDNGNDRIQDLINTGDENDFADNSGSDGHGTSVAAAIGGRTYGVAKSANLLNVKHEVKGRPRATRVTQALEQILARHKKQRTQSGFKGSVINMSFRLTFDSGLVRDAIKAAYEGGISLVASAGNEKYQPGHFPSIIKEVISVGASDINYVPAVFSNFGASPITDIWAPGEDVPLILKDGTEAACRGTSFAAAFTTGIISIFYGEEGTDMNPTLATTRLLAQTDDWIDLAAGKDWKGSPRAFANSGNRKGQEARPPVKYIGGDQVDGATASPSPTNSPTPKPTPSNVCGNSYQFLFDNFEIHGKNFNATQIGEDGSELKKTIEKHLTSGSLTDWGFKKTPNDPDGWQWYCHGHTVVGQQDDIGDALKELHGDADSCKGGGL